MVLGDRVLSVVDARGPTFAINRCLVAFIFRWRPRGRRVGVAAGRARRLARERARDELLFQS